MSFRSIVRDVRDSIGSFSRRSFDVWLSGHERGEFQSHCSFDDWSEPSLVVQSSRWADIPPELLFDVIQRLEESENAWPARRHVVACASVCRSWRSVSKEIVKGPEICWKLTFPVSMKQPGARDGTIQCFIKRNKPNLTYHLFLNLSPTLQVEKGKFLLSAKRTRRSTYTEFAISMDANSISKSSSTYIGKLRSNFFGTKFIIYDTQAPHTDTQIAAPGRSSCRFSSKVSPKVPARSYNIAQIAYELNVLGSRGPRKMQCTMQSIPVSSLDVDGTVPGQPELLSRSLEDSFRSMSFSKSLESSFNSQWQIQDLKSRCLSVTDDRGKQPLVLTNKSPRWHEQLQCWCLNFHGRVTIASVKNFQLVVAMPPAASGEPNTTSQASQSQSNHEKVILQFGKVGKDMFTMDYRYPLSAFQAFAICLSSFDSKLACE